MSAFVTRDSSIALRLGYTASRFLTLRSLVAVEIINFSAGDDTTAIIEALLNVHDIFIVSVVYF